MWLVPRAKPLVEPGAPSLSDFETAALKALYVARASVQQKGIAARLLQRVREEERWIACDCRSTDEAPLLTAAYLTDAGVY